MWWEMKRKFFVAVLLSASLNQVVEAEPFWWAASYFDPHLRSAQLACEYTASRILRWSDTYYAGTVLAIRVKGGYGECLIKHPPYPNGGGALPPSWYSIVRWGDGCPDNQEYDANTGACLSPNGPPNHGPDCSPPSLSAGNPINIATGNKYQSETDYAGPAIAPLLRFTRHYNSSNGLWTHNLSARLTLQSHMVTLHREDGRTLDFIRLYDRITSQADNLGRLEKIDGGWRYDEPSGLRLDFDEAGVLVELVQASEKLRLAREGGQVRVSHNRYPGTFSFAEDDRQQPLRLTAPGLAVLYNYEGGHLIRVARDAAGQASEQRYHYEDPRNPRLLTGITDNRGVRFATWRYDEKGRAVSSEHANGAEKVSLAYNFDGSTTVTNEYGKQATYRFQVIRGSKHIVAIEGQPSPNCPSSNSTFTYDDQGLLTSKRDNNGNLTTYQYNARGLETSRTEAAGTAQARTITTDWHPTLFLPVQVSEPGRITRYQYDAEGRKTGETVTTR